MAGDEAWTRHRLFRRARRVSKCSIFALADAACSGVWLLRFIGPQVFAHFVDLFLKDLNFQFQFAQALFPLSAFAIGFLCRMLEAGEAALGLFEPHARFLYLRLVYLALRLVLGNGQLYLRERIRGNGPRGDSVDANVISPAPLVLLHCLFGGLDTNFFDPHLYLEQFDLILEFFDCLLAIDFDGG